MLLRPSSVDTVTVVCSTEACFVYVVDSDLLLSSGVGFAIAVIWFPLRFDMIFVLLASTLSDESFETKGSR